MRELSSDYLAAAKSAGRYPNIKAEIGGTLTLTGDDAIIKCHIMRGDSAKPSFFETALALSSECRITVDRRRIANDSAIKAGAKVVVWAFFNTPAGTVAGTAKLGTYYVTSYDKSDSTNGIITASDFLLYTGIDFNPESLTYPCNISDMLIEAFRQSGKTLSSVTLAIDPRVKKAPYKSEKPVAENMNGNPYTCREVIAKIAGMNLGAIFIDADENPKIYSYAGNVSIADNNILDIRIGSETYEISQVLVFKTEERMAKKKSGYKQLPYAPRFENMDDIGTGSSWLDDINAEATRIRRKPWTTATITIQGIGEIEPGDFATAAGTSIFVTGISYDFSNANFTETLYSYAYTEEEYYMAPAKTVDVSTGAEKKSGGVGENVGQHNERFNGYTETDGSTITGGDYNHAENYKNTLTGCNKSSAGGSENLLNGCTNTFVHGYKNKVYSNSGSVIAGNENTVTPYIGSTGMGNICVGTNNEIHGTQTIVAGHSHTVAGSYNNVSGEGHTVSASEENIVGGQGNTLTNARKNIVGGTNNTVTGVQNLVGGADNTVSGNSSGCVGGNHKLGKDGCFAAGYGTDTSQITTGNVRLIIGNGGGNSFYVTASGDVYAVGGYNSLGADYAEYFEWADGNPDNERRYGMLVAIRGDRIVPAHGDDFLGIISANPSVVGNAYEMYWHGKYVTDVFGKIITTPDGVPIISDEYDPALKYIPRSQRPEWAAVGLTGRIVVCDNGSCVPGGYVSARNGIGAASLHETRARVLRRIDSTHVEVLIG